MSLSLLYDFSTETVINGTNHQAEHANIANKFNAGIASADLSPTAGIALSQLAASYQAMQVQLTVSGSAWAGTFVANDCAASTPLVGVTGSIPWIVTDIYSVCTDVGAKTQSFSIYYVGDTGAGAFNWGGGSTQVFGPYTLGSTGAANTAGLQILATGLSTTLTLEVGIKCFALRLLTAVDGTVMSTVKDFWTISINLRRQITA